MNTVSDWVTIIIFAGLVTDFLQQSADENARETPLWQYLVAAAGCALANWLGNSGQAIASVAVIAVTLGFIIYVYLGRRGPRADH
jgi:hypothetical protein